MTNKAKTVDCICCWYDFLGFGQPFKDSNWDLTNEAAQISINRILDESIVFHGSYSFSEKTTRFHCNDGIATNYDLEKQKEDELQHLKIITFLDGIITDYESINRTDTNNGFPGVRGVLTAGHRLYCYDQVNMTELNDKVVAYHPKEFQLNTAFSKASIIEETIHRGKIDGPVLYIDDALFSMLSNHGLVVTEKETDDSIIFSVSNGSIDLYMQKEIIPYNNEDLRISTSLYKLQKKCSYIDRIYEFPLTPNYGNIED